MSRLFYKPAVLLVTLIFLISTACVPAHVPDTPTPQVTSLPPYTPTQSPTLYPSRTIPPLSTPKKTTPTPFSGAFPCSPLEDVTISQLPDILSNPFEMNRPGLDDGHHGADFAYYRMGSHIGMAGLLIYSVMPGQVAGTITNRMPYGNAIIIETPLAGLPPDWLAGLALPRPGVFIDPQPAMNCPDLTAALPPSNGEYSLYLLYAHMQSPTNLTAGERVSCGQAIGRVGTTGESVNEHLHLETRIGPSGVRFGSMAYYDTSRTEEEAALYCIWRVSNIFQPFDPMILLSHRSLSSGNLPQ